MYLRKDKALLIHICNLDSYYNLFTFMFINLLIMVVAFAIGTSKKVKIIKSCLLFCTNYVLIIEGQMIYLLLIPIINNQK
jgi:hypothetical protein